VKASYYYSIVLVLRFSLHHTHQSSYPTAIQKAVAVESIDPPPVPFYPVHTPTTLFVGRLRADALRLFLEYMDSRTVARCARTSSEW